MRRFPPISPEEKAVSDSLKSADLDAIDSCILSHCSQCRLKVARIISRTENELIDRFPGLSYIFYTLRLQHLVQEGYLEGFGDLSVMRFSEVCLTDTYKTEQGAAANP
jgi:hypothetical protein